MQQHRAIRGVEMGGRREMRMFAAMRALLGDGRLSQSPRQERVASSALGQLGVKVWARSSEAAGLVTLSLRCGLGVRGLKYVG